MISGSGLTIPQSLWAPGRSEVPTPFRDLLIGIPVARLSLNESADIIDCSRALCSALKTKVKPAHLGTPVLCVSKAYLLACTQGKGLVTRENYLFGLLVLVKGIC